MEYYALSFFAGIFTVFSPCTLPLLPAVLGSYIETANELNSGQQAGVKNKFLRPLVILTSLAISILLFTLLVKSSAELVAPQLLTTISSLIIIAFGIVTVFPQIWTSLSIKLGLSSSSGKLASAARRRNGLLGDIFLGLALGPLFTSCSPTFALVLAVVLPHSFTIGLINLMLYVVGLIGMLALISIGGQAIIAKLRWLANPDSHFKRSLGLLLIIIGMLTLLGLDKELQKFVINNQLLDITTLEKRLLPGTSVIIQ